MDSPTCQNCANFIQHYGLQSGKFYRLYCGHCTQSRIKKRYPDAKACAHFQPGPNQEEELVTKEYLHKALLQRLLSLETAPEIGP
ncbi:MAG: hypothetical protein IJ375_07870 [Oscillospiraceae bacterium]|nr:hypothetical protein [Oscillospiraceae bacterium]